MSSLGAQLVQLVRPVPRNLLEVIHDVQLLQPDKAAPSRSFHRRHQNVQRQVAERVFSVVVEHSHDLVASLARRTLYLESVVLICGAFELQVYGLQLPDALTDLIVLNFHEVDRAFQLLFYLFLALHKLKRTQSF